MIINYLHKIGWFVGLVLLQVLILNNVHIVGYATPFLYIYLILKFESDVPRNALMLWAFFLGLAVNIGRRRSGNECGGYGAFSLFAPYILTLVRASRYAGYIGSGNPYNGNLSFFEILGCQCLGTSRDAAYS
jgi:hypothetical protein